jgi:hypothetical protein
MSVFFGPKNEPKQVQTQVNFPENHSTVVEFNYNMNNDFETTTKVEKLTQTDLTQRKTKNYKNYKYTLAFQMTKNNNGDPKLNWYKNEVWVVNNNMTYHDAVTHLLKHSGVWYVLKEKRYKPVSYRRLNLDNVNKYEEMNSNGKGKCTVTKYFKDLCKVM